MKTDSISDSTGKGKHVTSHRELIILENGGIVIDNPGLREVGITDSTSGVEEVFNEISRFSMNCKFQDCTHTNEIGCAVLEALENGDMNKHAYENYLKIEKEKSFFETSVLEKRKKEKMFGRILKDYQKKDIKGKKY